MFDTIASWINDNLYTIAFVLPIFIGLITKAALPERFKAIVMLIVTAVVTLIASTQSGTPLDGAGLEDWGKNVVIAIASYYGVWKPLGLGNLAPNSGIGPKL